MIIKTGRVKTQLLNALRFSVDQVCFQNFWAADENMNFCDMLNIKFQLLSAHFRFKQRDNQYIEGHPRPTKPKISLSS